MFFDNSPAASWACWVAGVEFINIFANIFSTDIFSPPGEPNRVEGEGLVSARTNSVATTLATSAEDRFRISQLCGKNLTVRAIRSALVFVT